MNTPEKPRDKGGKFLTQIGVGNIKPISVRHHADVVEALEKLPNKREYIRLAVRAALERDGLIDKNTAP